MMTRPRSTPSCAKIACCASPDRPAAQVWVEIGTPVAFWARADARRMFSITGVTPAVSVAHLMMAALTPLVPMPRVMSRRNSSATASTPCALKYRCGIHQTPVATITCTRERRATPTIRSMSRPRSTVVRSTIARMPRPYRSVIFRSAIARMASRSQRWGQFSCTPGERVTMCSCISVGPSSSAATGPSAVSTVVMLTSGSEESVAGGASSSSAPGARRGPLDQVLRAGLNPREEARQHDAHTQPGVALDVGGGDQRAGHAASLDDLRQRPVDRPLDLGVFQVPDLAHRRRQVARSHEEDVDVIDRQDRIEVADGGDVLDQDDQHVLVVGGLEVVAHAEALAAGEHAALAEGRKLAGRDDRLGLGAGVDMRHHDALGATIEGAVDRGVVVVHHPDDRGHAPEVAGSRQVSEIGVVDPAVLALQPDSIRAKRAELIDQVRVVGAGQNRRHLAGGEPLFHAIRSDVHVVSLTCAPSSAPRSGPSARQPKGRGVQSTWGGPPAVASMAQDASLD